MGASHVPVEGTTAFAHPTDEFRGDACDQTVRGDILCDDGPSRNHRVPTDRDPTDDCGVRAERDTVLNLRLHPAPVWADRSRVKIIRKTDVGTDEDTVADRDSPVDRREILHFAIVPNQHLGINVDILSDDTVLANAGSLPDLRPMPNAAPFSDLCLRGDFRGRMDLRSHGTPQPSSRLKYVSGEREMRPVRSAVERGQTARPTMKPMTYAAMPIRETTITASRGSKRKLGRSAVRIFSACISRQVS